MHFSIHGPFDIKRVKGRIDKRPRSLRHFWETVDEATPGLSSACGCYVFTIRGVAHYVGMGNKQTFRRECFNPHKLLAYNSALHEHNGVPRLLLVARRTRSGSFSKPSKNGHRDVAFIESVFIGAALARNPDLQNVRGTKLAERIHVPGIINGTRGEANSKSVRALKSAIGV